MNKIYLEPIAKAESLAEGVRKQADVLEKKGDPKSHPHLLTEFITYQH